MTLDLDRLAALVAAMTPGPWHTDARPRLQGAISANVGGGSRQVAAASGEAPMHEDASIDPAARQHANAAGIAALVNAAPELLRLARVGAAYLAHEAAAWHPVAADDDAAYEAADVAYRALRDAYRAAKENP